MPTPRFTPMRRFLPLLCLLFAALPACDDTPDEDVEIALSEDPDADQDGYSTADCDDGDASVYPGATEVVDDVDQDCDGAVDEGTDAFDDDGDGFTEDEGDVDDSDASTYPDAPELVDGIDNDQDGTIDEGTNSFDDDGDGYSEDEGDADDDDADTYPDAPELADGVDNDQDGQVDEGLTPADADGDGYDLDDCDDSDNRIYPGAAETADGDDQDCDGRVDEGTSAGDDDLDGYSEDEGDCNDARASIHPGAEETAGGLPDGIDNDCDGNIDEGTGVADTDDDGFTGNLGDCDDGDASVFPGATEVANGIDDDCDETIDEDTEVYDDDGDLASEAEGDCDDADPTVGPTIQESCNGIDDDCNGFVDEPCQPCGIPGDFDDAAAAIEAGCAEVVVNHLSADAPLKITDPPGSLYLRSSSGKAPLAGLEISLSPQSLERQIRIEGFTLLGGADVDNDDANTEVVLRELTVDNIISEDGAVFLRGPGLTLEDSTITGATALAASDAGGAIHISDARGFTLRRLVLKENQAISAGAAGGGALYIAGAETTGTVEACLFDKNAATGLESGGAVFIADDVTASIHFFNNTFVRNSNPTNGDAAAIHCEGSLPGGRFNSVIMWHQSGGHISGCSEAAVSYSTFQGTAPEGTGNSNADPEFRADGSFTPAVYSGCIDAGDPDPARNDQDGSRNDQGYTGGPFGQ